MRTSAKQAAIRLKALGFEVLSVSEPNDDEDGEIKISDMVHVQVGYDHINVVKQHGEGNNLSFEFFPAAPGYDKLADDLRTALKE